MWETREQPVSSGVQLNPVSGDTPLSFRELFSLLGSNPDFAHWFSETLVDTGFAGFFLEFPPLTTDALEAEAEFVVIESAAVASLRADPTPFHSQFSRQQGADVITFPNMGGDALLVAPAQRGVIEAYPHLAAFLRKAPAKQISRLWQLVAEVVLNNLGETPKWLSTAGLGVAWLHIRLDSRPKYYSYAPYKTVTQT